MGGSPEEGRFHGYLRQHHYLGLRVVGENLKYLVQARDGQDVACLLFGAAAWQTGARDRFVGWTSVQRAGGLGHLVNNTRFLILPWVQVAGLASHVLSRTVRRLSADWQQKYGHPVFLVETFVERDRFAGTSYRAANWRWVGQTQGRGRQGPDPRRRTTSIKDVWVYPLPNSTDLLDAKAIPQAEADFTGQGKQKWASGQWSELLGFAFQGQSAT